MDKKEIKKILGVGDNLTKIISERDKLRVYSDSQSLTEKAVQLKKEGKLELATKTERVAKLLEEMEKENKEGINLVYGYSELKTDEDFDFYLSGIEALFRTMKEYGLSFEDDEKRLRLAEQTTKNQKYNN